MPMVTVVADDDFFPLNDAVHTGPCKLLRTVEEYLSVLSSTERFIGTAWCFEKPKRVESNGLFVVTADMVGGPYGYEGALENVDFTLNIPKIPTRLLSLIVADFKAHLDVERIFQIRWDTLAKEYVIVKPTEFKTSKCAIEYDFSDVPAHLKQVLEIHSHNTMPAYFSSIDDADELCKGFYGVVGRLDKEQPMMKFRVGMEGYFTEIPFEHLFE